MGDRKRTVGCGAFSCCGVTLLDLEPEKCDEDHLICLGDADNEYYVTINHPMDKKHYVSFIAYVTSGSSEVIKLYPEQEIAVSFRKKGHGMIYAYCNRHGMFRMMI